MAKKFEINGITYTAKEIDFNFLCDLEDEGISMTDVERKPMSSIRAYFTSCFGGDRVLAGKELEQHIINGGNLEELMEAFGDAIQSSGFFQAILKPQKKTTTRSTKKKAE